jgi:hypothetical protein
MLRLPADPSSPGAGSTGAAAGSPAGGVVDSPATGGDVSIPTADWSCSAALASPGSANCPLAATPLSAAASPLGAGSGGVAWWAASPAGLAGVSATGGGVFGESCAAPPPQPPRATSGTSAMASLTKPAGTGRQNGDRALEKMCPRPRSVTCSHKRPGLRNIFIADPSSRRHGCASETEDGVRPLAG